MQHTCFPELLEQLKQTMRHLETQRTISSNDPDLIHLQQALRDRIVDLEGYGREYDDDPPTVIH